MSDPDRSSWCCCCYDDGGGGGYDAAETMETQGFHLDPTLSNIWNNISEIVEALFLLDHSAIRFQPARFLQKSYLKNLYINIISFFLAISQTHTSQEKNQRNEIIWSNLIFCSCYVASGAETVESTMEEELREAPLPLSQLPNSSSSQPWSSLAAAGVGGGGGLILNTLFPSFSFSFEQVFWLWCWWLRPLIFSCIFSPSCSGLICCNKLLMIDDEAGTPTLCWKKIETCQYWTKGQC